MRRLIMCCQTILLLVACGDSGGIKRTVGNTEGENQEALREQFSIVFDMPRGRDFTNKLLITVGIKNKSARGGGYFSSGSFSGSYSGFGSWSDGRYSGSDCINLLFYDEGTAEYYPVLERSGVIHSFYYPHEDGELREYLVFFVSFDDSDKDGMLTGKDPRIAFLTDLDGRNAIQVTPDTAKVVHWGFGRTTSRMYFEVYIDSNKDSKFSSEDQTQILSVDTSNPKVGSNILTPAMRSQMATTFWETIGH